MDENVNRQAARLIADLATRYNLEIRPIRALFSDCTEGYSISLRRAGDFYTTRNPVIVTFHNDDQFGPRWHGLCGVCVPAHKVIPYINTVVEHIDEHPGYINELAL